ncbi:MAG: hypothetical protein M1825_000211 [Sarcosagium campestre]|nr:MAG: hypothetical protein M1825_000211 [Sarcosagium campestre]
MPKFYDSIPDDLRRWALVQSVFFTATAPLAGQHVNLSPKGLPSSTFSIFDGNHAAYVDATGSGAETISHVYENGRITIMFCSFETMPRIMRFFCHGTVVEWDQPQFDSVLRRMGKDKIDGARAVIMLDVFKVQTSCGYGVPMLDKNPTAESRFEDRKTLGHWASNKVNKNELLPYQMINNARSLDGLPGLRAARRDRGERFWLESTMAWLRRIKAQWDAVLTGAAFTLKSRDDLQYFKPQDPSKRETLFSPRDIRPSGEEPDEDLETESPKLSQSAQEAK